MGGIKVRIFDRKFFQYQTAYTEWYNLNTRFIFIILLLAAITFFTDDLVYVFAIPLLYAYGFIRRMFLFNMSDEKFIKKIEKQYEDYLRKNEKAQGQYAFQLEKILFAVELEKFSVKKALSDVDALLATRPKMREQANGLLLSIYLVGKQEGVIKKIPLEYIEHFDFIKNNEEDPNVLIDYVRLALKLGKNDLALTLLEKAEERKELYKKLTQPIQRSIYKTLQVTIPYYKAMAYFAEGKKQKGNEQLERAIKASKSNKLTRQLQEKEKISILE